MKKNYFAIGLKFLILTVVGSGLLSCGTSEKEEFTYFSGKIKNPRSGFVVLTKDGVVIDSARLDANNKFHFELDSIQEGLYRFKHGPEYQYLHLQPKDSLLLYLNTWDFDESLIYSGQGSARNNFLISLFLNWESTEMEFEDYYDLDEKEFNEKIEAGINKGMQAFENKVASTEEVSPFYEKIAKAGICSPYYILKEKYPLHHKKTRGLKEWPELSEDYYEFRKDFNLNDEELADYATFVYYVNNFLIYSTVKEKYTDPEFENFDLKLLENTKKWITLDELKNHFFAKFTYNTLNKEHLEAEKQNEVVAFFKANCTDQKMISDLDRSIEQRSKIKRGDALPNMTVVDPNGKPIRVDSLIRNSSSVIYFWPNDLMLAESVRIRLAKLEKNYPDLMFVGINRIKQQDQWVDFLEANNISKENQFRLEEKEECYSWFEGDMSRAILVNNDNKVLYSYLEFTNLNPDYYFGEINK